MANIEGLYSRSRGYKLGMLQEMMEDSNTLLAALTETHLNSDVLDAEVNMRGYEIYRADRVDRVKGGVAVYLKKEYAPDCITLAKGSRGLVEYILLHIKKLDLIVANVYRSPVAQSPDFVHAMNTIKTCIGQLEERSSVVVICGDFNMPRTSWSGGFTRGGSLEERLQADHLLELQSELLLTQMVDLPTRGENVLDLCFTNDDSFILDLRTEDSIMTDHRLIRIKVMLGYPTDSIDGEGARSEIGFANLNFFHSSICWDSLVEDLQDLNWSEVCEEEEVNQVYNLFHDSLFDVCQRHIPKKRAVKRRRDIPRDRRTLMKQKNKLVKRRMRARGDIGLDLRIQQIDNQISLSHIEEQRREEELAVEAIRNNSKYFFSYAKSKRVCRPDIGPLEQDGALISDPGEMAEILRLQYESVFSQPMQPSSLNISPASDGVAEDLPSIRFRSEDFVEAAGELRSNSAAGPDGIPAVLIKKCIVPLSVPLQHLWTQSMRTGRIPTELKVGKITPIYKGGNKCEPKNYRPVALTSHVIKLFEKILTKRLQEFLEESGQMCSSQHGFRRGRSCLSQLLDHYQKILGALSEGENVDVVYLDFAKAFDKVDHTILLEKVHSAGIRGEICNWIKEFLTGRKQFVAVMGSASQYSDVLSGVPQGSVLGPLLFLVHISDIGSRVQHSVLSSFADDTRVLKGTKSELDCRQLQSDLEEVYRWSSTNNMAFNSGKFELIRYKCSEEIPYNYTSADGHIIEEASEVSDLGVLMSSDGTFSKQIEAAATKGRQRASWVMRVFKTRDARPMLTLYRALILPILEYCCQLWCPSEMGLIRQLEGVQRSFTYRIQGMNSPELDYWQRLSTLKLYSLERRRERYLIIYVWKILSGLSPNLTGSDKIESYENPRRGRLCHIPRLNRGSTQRVATLRENSLSIRGPRLFNCLPKNTRAHVGCIESFKTMLDQFLSTVPDKPCLAHYYQSAANNSLIRQLEQQQAERL